MSDSSNVTVVKPDWLPAELYQMWVDAYIDAGGSGVSGSADFATEQVRKSSQYDQMFPGIKREDGSIRYPNYPEATYLNNMESFKNAVSAAGVEPSMFDNLYVNLIAGDVSPQEFNNRVENINQRVLLAGAGIRQYYGETFGLDITDAGIIASLLDPDQIGQAVLNRQITMAEIGGEAANRNYDLASSFVTMLAETGMDRNEAQRLFGTAESMLPMLGKLAARHADPDDTFDITEFVEAQASGIMDPEQAARIRRLMSQEASSFTGNAATDIVRDERTGVTGLAAR